MLKIMTDRSNQRIYGFPPVWRSDARLLILGSMPSVESLRQGFYYAHPRNAFWPMMADLLGEQMPNSMDQKKEILLKHHIALWDSAQSCEREGSLDSAIRVPRANDFAALYRSCPQIRHVFFNGAAACQLYRRLVSRQDEDARRVFHRMPSTSPAYTLRYEEKLKIWKKEIEEALKNECC